MWILDINENGEGKSVKTGQRRHVPIHRALIGEGFLTYARTIASDAPLFPDKPLDRFGNRGGRAWNVIGKWVWNTVGITISASLRITPGVTVWRTKCGWGSARICPLRDPWAHSEDDWATVWRAGRGASDAASFHSLPALSSRRLPWKPHKALQRPLERCPGDRPFPKALHVAPRREPGICNAHSPIPGLRPHRGYLDL